MENIKYVRVWSDFIPQLAKMSNAQRGAAFAILLNEIFGTNISDTDCDIAQIVAAGMVEKAKAEIAEAEQANQARAEKVKARWQKSNEETHEQSSTDKQTTNQEQEAAPAPKEVKPRAIFKKPSIEEVKAYIKEKNYELDADHWYSYYESNGWMVGKNKMKDWKAAVLTWLKNGYGSKNKGGASAPQMRTHPNVLHQEDMPCTDF